MEPEDQIKYGSKISVESRKSNISSCRSLERPNWSQRAHSINKNKSLIEVMSLEGSKKSDLYQKILAEEVRGNSSKQSKPISKQFNPFRACFKTDIQQHNRFSYQQPQEFTHICLCYLSCKKELCPCYAAKNQECSKDYCCKDCIETKIKLMQRGSYDSIEQIKKSCTCKKTKCNKKYCSCFANGLKCGRDCTCEDCGNCDRPTSMQIEPTCIVDSQIIKMEMPQKMDFEPFQFRYSNNS